MPRFPHKLLLALLLIALPAFSQTAPEPGISHALAQSRAARLSNLHYTLAFTLVAKAPAIAASETLTFTDSSPQDLALDFRDGNLLTAKLNGAPIAVTLTNGHLILPAAALRQGPNTLATTFTANIAPSGKAITRYLDKDDGNEYLYTLFVPMDADMAFPCFDQPDLKATFKLTVDHPANWTIIGNTSPFLTSSTESTFPETKPISTYLFAFAAGPFAKIPGKSAGEPAVYVRQSQLAKAQAEAPEVQSIAEQGIAWLSDYFAQPFPFPKYDLVLIPGFPFGGMEHAGATFLNEDGVLFRSTPTQADFFKRDILVLHETTHQWFGDLVTMRWFDDLWLKEGFAQYMAYKAMADLKPATNPWKHFNEDIKPLAYAIDETEGTTPIFQDIPNLKDAKSAYGAIVYQKAPAILKQLEFRIGNDNFRSGLRFYLKQHAYSNATWPDLIQAFEQAGAKDLKAWADAWITHRGMPEITAEFSCNGDRLQTIKLHQRDVLGTDAVWPLSNEILLSLPPQPKSVKSLDLTYQSEPIRADWDESTIQIHASHTACPNYIFANFNDQAYGRFLLNASSQAAVVRTFTARTTTASGAPGLASETWVSTTPQDPLLTTQLWTALWDNVRTAHASPADYTTLALKTLPTEPDESLNRIQGARITQSLHDYLGPKSREALQSRAEQVVQDRMLHAPTLNLRIVNFRTFTTLAETRPAIDQLKRLLEDPNAQIPGLTLQPRDRWDILAHLAQQGEPHTADLLSTEQSAHHTGEDQKYAYAAQAAIPNAETKAQYFADYTSTKIQEDWLTQSLRPFNSYNQQALTLPYLKQSLDLLPQIKANRKIFFLGAWLSAFLDGQSTPEAQAIVNHWLTQSDIDPDLRRKVLENKDALDRAVLIRRTYPN